MKKIIIVTGGAGFVGSNLIDYLVKKTKYNIFSIDNYSSGSKKNHIINKRVKYFNCHTKNIEKKLNNLINIKNKLTLFFTLVNFLEFIKALNI